MEVASGALSLLGSIPEPGAFGLVTTADGRLVTFAATGTLWKFDPASGASSALGTESTYPFALALGPGGALYSYNLLSGAIQRRVLGTSTSAAPSSFAAGVALMGNSGLCATRSGEVFYIPLLSSEVRRFVDLNGDGDALDPGEDTLFATLPYVWGVDSLSFVQSMIPGSGRSVLLNIVPLSDFDPAFDGIWWARDLDGNGVADSVARHTPAHVDTFEMWSLTSTR